MSEEANQKTSVPSVAMVLYAQNEERFIEAALQSVFVQDYSKLEILLSDDGSTDRTFEIMHEMKAAYRGPHRILLNRNPAPVGIGGQINWAVWNSDSELIVLVNGDDISHSDRVSRTVAMWQPEGAERATAVWSALRQIDENGKMRNKVMDMHVDLSSLASGVASRFSGGGAASLALDRKVFDSFGPMPANLILEDSALFCRAVLLGDVRYSEQPWVDYRVHQGNISQSYHAGDFEEWRARHHKKTQWQRSESVKCYIEILRDLHQAPAETWSAEQLKRSRWIGMLNLVRSHMESEELDTSSKAIEVLRIRDLAQLILMLMRVRLRRAVPWIRKRNDRWHFQRVVDANWDSERR